MRRTRHWSTRSLVCMPLTGPHPRAAAQRHVGLQEIKRNSIMKLRLLILAAISFYSLANAQEVIK